MTQAKTHHIVSCDEGVRVLSTIMVRLQGSNEEGSLMCHGDGATYNRSTRVHEECLEKGNRCL